MSTEFGENPRLLHRTDGPDTSKAAAETVDTTRLESAVYSYVEACGEDGATIAECVKHFNPESDSSITSRPASLERKSLVYYRGDTRKGNSGRQQRIIRINRRKKVGRYFGTKRRENDQW